MANQAAWLDKAGAVLDIREAPYPKIKAGHVVVRNKALAINPIDWKMQDFGILVQSWPVILGTDVAGEVVEVGDDVTGFKKNDRVFGLAWALSSGNNEEAAFQLYTSLPATVLGILPDGVSFEAAVALPVALACAAAGLYEGYALNLTLPGEAASTDSSVGSSAIQLAKASGIHVIATTSPKNFAYVKRLGAIAVFDYTDLKVVERLAEILSKGSCVGAFDTVGKNISQCAGVLSKLGGGTVVATADPPEFLPTGVTARHVFATTIKDDHIGKAIFQDFIPKAMAKGTFVPSPPSTVVGNGLDAIQGGIERCKEGVSASKVVVSLK